MATAAGVDLAVKRGRASHVAVLHDRTLVALGEAVADDALVAAVLDHAPDVVAIDAPLTPPDGRTGAYWDREAEVALRRAGHRVIAPGLMGALTFRGAALAARFRAAGVTVIETHPRSALELFGLRLARGESKTRPDVLARGRTVLARHVDDVPPAFASADEMDAIAAAVVALRHAEGATVAFGAPDEGVIHLPAP